MRTPWFDEKTQTPLLDQYARQLDSFLTTMADGVVEDRELHDQEHRLVALMKELEPLLNDEQHEKVTKLLCEVTAYDIMQLIHTLQQSKPKTKFRG
jgi:hypothetical protein